MTKILTLAAVLTAIASTASAASLPPGPIDWQSPDVYTADEDEVELPPGEWCLVLSVHNNPGELRTLTYMRGTFDWCDPEDRIVVRDKP
jgi:hypothetical protein